MNEASLMENLPPKVIWRILNKVTTFLESCIFSFVFELNMQRKNFALQNKICHRNGTKTFYFQMEQK
jgi:hypothetical protein